LGRHLIVMLQGRSSGHSQVVSGPLGLYLHDLLCRYVLAQAGCFAPACHCAVYSLRRSRNGHQPGAIPADWCALQCYYRLTNRLSTCQDGHLVVPLPTCVDTRPGAESCRRLCDSGAGCLQSHIPKSMRSIWLSMQRCRLQCTSSYLQYTLTAVLAVRQLGKSLQEWYAPQTSMFDTS
jgi:hypothetical protein